MKVTKVIFGVFMAQLLCLFVPQIVFCQTETLDIVQYTPPKGWTKTPREGAMVFSDINKSTNGFCILTVYANKASAGSPEKDFANEWNELIVKAFKAEANPKTEIQTQDGWTSVAGAAQIEIEGGKSYVIMTVLSGYGKTASVYALLNDQSYLPQIDAFMASIKLDKTTASSNPTPTPTIQENDPFPDRPGYEPQKPLSGTLNAKITMADLVGTWDHGAGSVQTYIDSYSGDYSGTNTTFYGEQYSIRSDGTFTYRFVGRSNNRTVRELDSGNVILSGGYITFKFKGRLTQKYQLIAFMNQPGGAAILSLVGVHDNFQGYDAAGMSLECGHNDGFIRCVGGEEWARLSAKPAR
ncbi:MAG TPA: hypothetical protein VN920_03690 [Pyrinomonadaceae bacterium]|nr:hypothetical protein [Pyrinomonadaceae bacterium]